MHNCNLMTQVASTTHSDCLNATTGQILLGFRLSASEYPGPSRASESKRAEPESASESSIRVSSGGPASPQPWLCTAVRVTPTASVDDRLLPKETGKHLVLPEAPALTRIAAVP